MAQPVGTLCMARPACAHKQWGIAARACCAASARSCPRSPSGWKTTRFQSAHKSKCR